MCKLWKSLYFEPCLLVHGFVRYYYMFTCQSDSRWFSGETEVEAACVFVSRPNALFVRTAFDLTCISARSLMCVIAALAGFCTQLGCVLIEELKQESEVRAECGDMKCLPFLWYLSADGFTVYRTLEGVSEESLSGEGGELRYGYLCGCILPSHLAFSSREQSGEHGSFLSTENVFTDM